MTDAQIEANVREAFLAATDALGDELPQRLATGARARLAQMRRRRTVAISTLSIATAAAAALVLIAVIDAGETSREPTHLAPPVAGGARVTPAQVSPTNRALAKKLAVKERALRERERELAKREMEVLEREIELLRREQRLLQPNRTVDSKPGQSLLRRVHGGEFEIEECAACHQPKAGFRSTPCDELTCLVEPSKACCALQKRLQK